MVADASCLGAPGSWARCHCGRRARHVAAMAECGEQRMGGVVAMLLCWECLSNEGWAERALAVLPLVDDEPAEPRGEDVAHGAPVASWPPGGRLLRGR